MNTLISTLQKTLYVLLVVFCSQIQINAQTAISLTIPTTAGGDGASMSGFNYTSPFSWSNRIITKQELIAAAIYGPVTFTGIQFRIVGPQAEASSVPNQSIWIKHVGTTKLVNANDPQPDINGFTCVLNNATVDYPVNPGASWFQIDFDTLFDWNGNENIQIVTQNKVGSFLTAYPLFIIKQEFYATGDERLCSTGQNFSWPITSGTKTRSALLTQLVYTGENVSVEESKQGNFILSQNYPNPATDLTHIDYEISVHGNVSFRVYDMTGRLVYSVEQGKQIPGKYTLTIDTKQFVSGLYFFTLQIDSKHISRKMRISKNN